MMKTVKSILLASIILFSFSSLMAQKPIEIKGKVNHNTFEKVEISLAYTKNEKVVATAPVRNDGTFTLHFTASQSDLYKLQFTEKDVFLAPLSPGEKVFVELDGRDLSFIMATSGSKSLEFVKQISDQLKRSGFLLDSINNALQTDKTQLYFSGFYKIFSPFQQTNTDIDNYLSNVMEASKLLSAEVAKYEQNPKKQDSLLLAAPALLKKVRDPYQVFENYMSNIRPHYDLQSGRVLGEETFYAKVDRYTNLLDERYSAIKKNMNEYITGIKRLADKNDSLSYNGLLQNKKTGKKFAIEIAAHISKYAPTVVAMTEDFDTKAKNSANLSAEILTDIQTAVSNVVAQHQQTYDTQNRSAEARMRTLLLTHKDDLGVLMFMDLFPRERNVELHNELTTALYAKHPSNPVVMEKYQIMTAPANATNIGSIAPDLAFPNPDGKILKLSNLRGKYVLLDFWASWCGPCRRENPHVVSMYNKYHDKGFEVFSVSLDRDKASWLKAIAADNLTWENHVSDLKYWSSEAAKKYGVSSIPATFLLDKDGKIIAKNLRGEQLTQALKNIFGE